MSQKHTLFPYFDKQNFLFSINFFFFKPYQYTIFNGQTTFSIHFNILDYNDITFGINCFSC